MAASPVGLMVVISSVGPILMVLPAYFVVVVSSADSVLVDPSAANKI